MDGVKTIKSGAGSSRGASDRKHPTDFQNRVYDAIRLVPRGCVTTYKLVAEHIGCGSPRAVGQALRRNPFAPAAPCHRVIASDFTIGGFQGKASGAAVRRKLGLLIREDVHIDMNLRIDPCHLFRYAEGRR